MNEETLPTNPLRSGDIDFATLSPEEFRTLFEQELQTQPIREGSVVQGRVIDIRDEHVVVDIRYKSEGIIDINEFRDGDGNVDVKVGQEFDVYLDTLEDEDGVLVLSKERADMMKAWDEISKACEQDEVVEGVIIARVKGGLAVDIGVKAFLPGSQVDLRPVKNLDKLIGTRAKFKVIKFNKKRGNIVLSRRVLLEKEREERRKETLKKIRVGAVVDGTVKNITDYGAFIDLGGIDGLLHITDMTWGRITHPSEMFNVGDEVQVRILKFDADTQRVSLGFKQISEDPWLRVAEKYPIHCIVQGRVVSLPDYGAFIELEDGIEGLVHITEMTWNKRVKHPSKLVNVGDMVQAIVLDVDIENKRISLGMKQLEENPWDVVEARYPVGSVVTGKIRNITDFGVFVGIEDGIDGLVHVSDLSWGTRGRNPADRHKKGDDLTAKVINIDRANERFSLSVKALTDDPWLSVTSRYFYGQEVKGIVSHVTEYGVFVEIEDGVEGLVHVSELTRQGVPTESYQEGESLDTWIISIDGHERKIGLTERGLESSRAAATSSSTSTRLTDVKGGEILQQFARRQREDTAE